MLFFLISLFGLIALPLLNTFGRTLESQADMYSLRTENRPDALSTALVKTADIAIRAPTLSRSSSSTITLRWSGASALRWSGRPRIPSRER